MVQTATYINKSKARGGFYLRNNMPYDQTAPLLLVLVYSERVGLLEESTPIHLQYFNTSFVVCLEV